MKKRKIIVIALVILLALLGILIRGCRKNRGELLLECLPEGYWFSFEGRMREDKTVLLQDLAPEKYRLPSRIRTFSADNFREVMEGRRAEHIDKKQADVLREKREGEQVPAFMISFLTEQGDRSSMVVCRDGRIYIYNQPTYPYQTFAQKGGELCFRDDGSCYAALRKNFGGSEDLKLWYKWWWRFVP